MTKKEKCFESDTRIVFIVSLLFGFVANGLIIFKLITDFRLSFNIARIYLGLHPGANVIKLFFFVTDEGEE
jgi:hypothetical protein